jgi:hypothetical protein
MHKKIQGQTTCGATRYDVSISPKELLYSVNDPPPVRFEFRGLNNRFDCRYKCIFRECLNQVKEYIPSWICHCHLYSDRIP